MGPPQRFVLTLIAVVVTCGSLAHTTVHAAQPAKSATTTAKPFVYEFYYRVRWGHLDEFLTLYKKNHYPILRRQRERGEILAISAAFPVNHTNENRRWDLRVTIKYRDAIVAHEDPSDAPWAKELYPDQATFKKEEQQRFELLLEHMDIAILEEDVSSW